VTSTAKSAAEALYGSGKLHPLRPLLAPLFVDPRALAGADVLFRAVESLAGPLGLTRFDVVMNEGGFALLEVQAGDPSAMGWHGALAEAFGQPPSLMLAHRRAFERLTDARSIAFAVKRGSIVESDHQLLAEHYRAHGWTAVVVDPSELRFTGGALYAGDTPVRAVFRDALDELLPTPGGPALTAAVDARAVVMLNPFSAAKADDKSLLEPLSTFERWDSETARVLRAHVPCTRLVRERRCDWEGAGVEMAQLLKQRDALVLKPVDGYGGIGVTLGHFVTDAQWSAAVDAALMQPDRFVVQRFHPLPELDVETLEGRVRAHVVHSFWFCPELAGAFYRASRNPIVNVHQGGGLAPVFFR
jgi:hypothetical protein